MNANGVVMIIAGVWLIAQLVAGDMLARLKVI